MKALKLILLYVFFVFFMHGMENTKSDHPNNLLKIIKIMINYYLILHSKDTLNSFRIMKSLRTEIRYKNFLQNQYKNFTIFKSKEIKNDKEKTSESFFNDIIFDKLQTVTSQLCEETIITSSDSNENINNKEKPKQR